MVRGRIRELDEKERGGEVRGIRIKEKPRITQIFPQFKGGWVAARPPT